MICNLYDMMSHPGDASIPRAWSKYSSGSSAFAAKNVGKTDGVGSQIGSALENARRQKHTEVGLSVACRPMMGNLLLYFSSS